MNGSQLSIVCPLLRKEDADAWAEALNASALEFEIMTPQRMQQWLANLFHESSGLTLLAENMNYSAQRLCEVWPARYAVDATERPLRPNAHAMNLDHKPDVIASDVYANRMGNGPPHTRDGWRFRGRYPCMLTGRNNYVRCHHDIGIPSLDNPDALLQDIPAMARVSGWYWAHNDLNKFADMGDFRAVSQIWNLGGLSLRDPIGWVDRCVWHKRICASEAFNGSNA